MKNFLILLLILLSSLVFGQGAQRQLDTDIIQYKEITTPSSPAVGKYKVYTKSGSLYILNSAGTETAIGSGGSGGGVSQWLTGTNYSIDDVVLQSNKFYIALTDHLSTVFV